MKIFEDREFCDFYDDASGRIFDGLKFINCTFVSCWLSISENANRRTAFRDIRFVGARHLNCGLNSAVVEDVIIDGLVSKKDPLFCRGAVFKHVALRGDVDRIVLRPHSITGIEDQAVAKGFSNFRHAYYSDVDWALDISEVRCIELDIHSVPADLVRRESQSQAVVRRSSISAAKLSELSWLGPEFRTSIERFLARGDEDLILVAPKRKRRYKRLVNEIERLRDIGVADCD